MKKKKILTVDDEADIRELINYSLTRENFDVITAADGESALRIASDEKPDLIILDLMLPGIDGLEVCQKIRNDDAIKHIPIIMLTAKTEEADQVIGLKIGADDYITKPFSPRVLVARVNAALRRHRVPGATLEEDLEYGDVQISPSQHRCFYAGEELNLTPIEFKILYCLIGSPGRVFSRHQIIDKAQGEDVVITDRTVDVHIVSLRKKMGDAAEFIETVRGIGYRYKELNPS